MKIASIGFCILLSLGSKAQSGNYSEDLAALKAMVEKTPSYKAQIKDARLSEYRAVYARLAAEPVSNPNSYEYFYHLAQLLFPLHDNHLGFYQLADFSHFKTKASIDSFVATKEFQDYPSLQINIDSLAAVLVKKPAESIEGIYHYDKFYTVGLFKNGDKDFIGVVLNSEVNLWMKGQIAIHLYEFAPDLYKAVYGHPLFKSLTFQPVEKYQNQSLVNSYFYGSYSQAVYSKNLGETDYVNLPKSTSKFILKNMADDVQYLLIQTFQADSRTSQSSRTFYDSIQNSLKAKHLILDLRNKEGGAEKEMKKYFKLLKQYVKSGRLYVLINNGTLSQAERFTLRLKDLRNVTTLGQTTKGMLTYGSNSDRRQKLPSGRFEFYPTDMRGSSKMLPYEDRGIAPDIVLSSESDWLNQAIEIIHRNKRAD